METPELPRIEYHSPAVEGGHCSLWELDTDGKPCRQIAGFSSGEQAAKCFAWIEEDRARRAPCPDLAVPLLLRAQELFVLEAEKVQAEAPNDAQLIQACLEDAAEVAAVIGVIENGICHGKNKYSEKHLASILKRDAV